MQPTPLAASETLAILTPNSTTLLARSIGAARLMGNSLGDSLQAQYHLQFAIVFSKGLQI
jgi:hypothetical protein